MTGKYILIIEDDARLQRLYEKTLTGQGYTTQSVDTISEAIHRLEVNKPCLILLDLNLPDGNGERLLQWLQKPEYHKIETIVVSGDTFARYNVLKHYRVAEVLMKPLSPRTLISFINMVPDIEQTKLLH